MRYLGSALGGAFFVLLVVAVDKAVGITTKGLGIVGVTPK